MRSGRQALTHAQGWQPQSGFSLIELMVAITVSMIIILALISGFLNFSRTNKEMSKSNKMIENGRLAALVLQSDLQHAGFWGEYVPEFDNLTWAAAPTDAPNSVPDPCSTYDPAVWDTSIKSLVGIPLQAYDAPPSSCGSLITNKKPPSDILVVRHAEPCIPGESRCEPDVPGKLYFQVSRCSTDAVPYVLGTSGFNLHNMDCTTIAPKRKYLSSIYYIRDFADNPGDGIPTLVRSQFDLAGSTLGPQSVTPLIEGIESMKVEIGVDSLGKTGSAVDYTSSVKWQDETNRTTPVNRGDGAPDGDFISCSSSSPCSAAQLANTVAARIHLLARNPEPTPGYTDDKTYQLGASTLGPFNDSFKRHVFSTTVRLVNISARRETP